MMGDKTMYGYAVREIEAWRDKYGWTYNNIFYIDTFYTRAESEKSVKRLFVKFLKEQYGITFKRRNILIEQYGNDYVIINRKTKEPLYDCVLDIDNAYKRH